MDDGLVKGCALRGGPLVRALHAVVRIAAAQAPTSRDGRGVSRQEGRHTSLLYRPTGCNLVQYRQRAQYRKREQYKQRAVH